MTDLLWNIIPLACQVPINQYLDDRLQKTAVYRPGAKKWEPIMQLILIILLAIALLLYGSEMSLSTSARSAGTAAGVSLAAAGVTATAAEAAVPGARKAEDKAEPRSQGPGLVLFDFAAQEPLWTTVDDAVMGGVSASTVRIDPQAQRLIFSGNVSLDNNGGFASTRSQWLGYDLTGFDGIALRVRGDGNAYRFRVRTEKTGGDVAYTALFVTKANTWQEIYIPFAEMVPLYRGMRVGPAGTLDAGTIRSFGLMVSDKQQGDFALEVDWINAVSEKKVAVQLASAR